MVLTDFFDEKMIANAKAVIFIFFAALLRALRRRVACLPKKPIQ
jgi:hypothetical protein